MRVGLIGCGHISNAHSRALYQLKKMDLADVAVTAVCDADAERAAKLARPHGATVRDVDALIEAVDVVYVCTPTASHLAIVEAAADSGRAIFCEKPLAGDLPTSERVADALRRVPHQVGLVMRHSPVFSAFAEEISSGRYGRPMSAIMRSDQYFPNQGMYGSSWRSDHTIAGAGTLIEHSIHDVDILRSLLGEPHEITCRTASFFGHPGIEDLATLSLAYPDSGLVTSLVSIWHQVLSRTSTRRLEVFCEEAHLWTTDDICGPLHIETSSGATERECLLPQWVDALALPEQVRRALGPYATASLHFLEAIERGEPGFPGATEALAAHRIVDAGYRSAAAGGAVVTI